MKGFVELTYEGTPMLIALSTIGAVVKRGPYTVFNFNTQVSGADAANNLVLEISYEEVIALIKQAQ
jgi:hypothetical protein